MTFLFVFASLFTLFPNYISIIYHLFQCRPSVYWLSVFKVAGTHATTIKRVINLIRSTVCPKCHLWIQSLASQACCGYERETVIGGGKRAIFSRYWSHSKRWITSRRATQQQSWSPCGALFLLASSSSSHYTCITWRGSVFATLRQIITFAHSSCGLTTSIWLDCHPTLMSRLAFCLCNSTSSIIIATWKPTTMERSKSPIKCSFDGSSIDL